MRVVWISVIALFIGCGGLVSTLSAAPSPQEREDRTGRLQERRERGGNQQRGQRGNEQRGNEQRGNEQRGNEQRGQGSNPLVVGEMAPEFFLDSLDGESVTDLATVRSEKPVVLFFGSYT